MPLYSLKRMTDNDVKVALDIPDRSKIEEHGIAIDAPTPSQVVMADPWAPGGNGQLPPPQEPEGSDTPEPHGRDVAA
jgi:hypothetical protein